jgi:hypothetical protein
MWLLARAQNHLGARPLWVVFVAGFVSATPPVEYLVVVGAILASGAATGIQLGAALTFTLLSLAVIEIPLVSCLVTPAKSQAVIMEVHNWVRARRRPIVAVTLAVGGVMLLASGMSSA